MLRGLYVHLLALIAAAHINCAEASVFSLNFMVSL